MQSTLVCSEERSTWKKIALDGEVLNGLNNSLLHLEFDFFPFLSLSLFISISTIKNNNNFSRKCIHKLCTLEMIDIMRPTSQSYFYLSFLLIKINFYLLSFLCDIDNDIYDHM